MKATPRLAFVGIAGCLVTSLVIGRIAFLSSTTVTGLGCAGADYIINGTHGTYLNDGSSSWPTSLGCTADGNGVIAVAATGAIAKSRDTVVRNDAEASFYASFQIQTTEPFASGLAWNLIGQESVSASSQGKVWSTFARADAIGTSIGSKNIAQAKIIGLTTPKGDFDEKTDGPKVQKRVIPLSNLVWGTVGGSQSCVVKIPSGLLAGSSQSSGPGVPAFGGGPVVSQTGASGGWSFYATGAKSQTSSTGVLAISVPPGRNAVGVDIYNSSGALIDKWGVDSLNGVSTLFIDDYAPGQYTLAFSADGTLVKKIALTLDPSTSQMVSPAWQYGDLDGDNYVSQSEVSFISAHVGYTLSTDPLASEKLPTFDSPYILASADLNGDGVITQADVALAQANVGVHGD